MNQNFITTSIHSLLLVGLTAISFSATAVPLKGNEAPPKKINIQAAMTQECIDQAVTLKMTDAKSASKICSCTIGVQASKLTLGEFWAIQSAAASGENPNTLAALQRIQPALDDCRKGINISKPQLPAAATKK